MDLHDPDERTYVRQFSNESNAWFVVVVDDEYVDVIVIDVVGDANSIVIVVAVGVGVVVIVVVVVVVVVFVIDDGTAADLVVSVWNCLDQ